MFGFLMERLLEEGALDVWYTPIFMKKNRPAVKASVLCRIKDEGKLATLLLEETTTLGVRSYSAARHILNRGFTTVETPYGPVSYKTASGSGIHKGAPEYEDVRHLAKVHGVPIRKVYEEAIKAYLSLNPSDSTSTE